MYASPLRPLWSIAALIVRATEPAVIENESVSQTLALSASVRAIGAQRLLHARMDWERLFSSANPPGAVTPTVAREKLTRQAIRRKEERRKSLRSGARGFVNAWK